MTERARCHDCDSDRVHEFEAFSDLPRVTSDCKAWPGGGRLTICRSCALLQAPATEEWTSECESIYDDYSVYHQSGGIEQAVFDPQTGEPALRSNRLAERLVAELALPEKGRLLDAGCGNGAFLRAISKVLPSWDLGGAELSDTNREVVLEIPGVREFHAMDLAAVPGRYSAISMIHLLEHVPNPSALLTKLASKLESNGFVFIQVPSPRENPFELLIADHCSHFTNASLLPVISRAGLSPLDANSSWLAKEISLVAKISPREASFVQSHTTDAESIAIAEQTLATEQALAWLGDVLAEARDIVKREPIAVFGTSIAATWLTGGIGVDAVSFFVDEDPGRQGRTHLGRPVVTPDAVPHDAQVFVPLAPRVAESLRDRLSPLPFDLIVPDASRLSL